MAKGRGLVRRAGRRPNRPEDGFSGQSPLAPAAPGRPAARLSPCGNPAFIFNANRIIRSNLYSFRRIFRPLPFGRSASFAKARIHRAKSMQGASLGNGSSPTPPQALCQAKEPGRSPLRPFLYILYFIIKLYIYSTESPHGFAITNAVYHFWRIKTPQNNSVKENQK